MRAMRHTHAITYHNIGNPCACTIFHLAIKTVSEGVKLMSIVESKLPTSKADIILFGLSTNTELANEKLVLST